MCADVTYTLIGDGQEASTRRPINPIYIEAHAFQRLVTAAQTKGAESVKERLWQLTNHVLPFVQRQNEVLQAQCRSAQEEVAVIRDEMVSVRASETAALEELKNLRHDLLAICAEESEYLVAAHDEVRAGRAKLRTLEEELKAAKLLKADMPKLAGDQEMLTFIRIELKADRNVKLVCVIRGQASYVPRRKDEIQRHVGRYGRIYTLQSALINPNARYNWKLVSGSMLKAGELKPLLLTQSGELKKVGESRLECDLPELHGAAPVDETILVYRASNITHLKCRLEALNKGRKLVEVAGQPTLRDFLVDHPPKP